MTIVKGFAETGSALAYNANTGVLSATANTFAAGNTTLGTVAAGNTVVTGSVTATTVAATGSVTSNGAVLQRLADVQAMVFGF